MSIIVSILVFSILVVVHEFGHYIVAKKSGVFVEEFAVGMGPLLFSKQIGETLYSIRAFPLGGFCRMMGEDEDLTDKRAFNNKSVLSRMAVIFAGPFMNFLFAFVIVFWLISTSGFIQPVITELTEGFSAEQAGIEIGDKVTKINGQKIHVYQDLQMIMMGVDNKKEVQVQVERQGQKLEYSLKPMYSEDTGGYIMGFTPRIVNGPFSDALNKFEKADLWETIKTSANTTLFYVRSVVIGFVRLFTFDFTPEEVSGPIGIIKVVGDTYEAGLKDSFMDAIKNVASLAALLSANLGALNLFPIPAMDGGRLLFLILEAIRRKPINQEIEGRIHFAGFVLLMAFMVFIAYTDISKIFLG